MSFAADTTLPPDEPLLVTGVAGFIGHALTERLLSAGHRVVGVDSLDSPIDPALSRARLDTLLNRPGFRFEHLDLAELAPTDALFRDVRPARVVHLAARAGVRASMEDPHAYTRANVEGFLNVLEGCRNGDCDHLIYASSSSVYGVRAEAPFSEADPVDHPVSLYAATKRANELMAHSYAHLYGIPTTGLRFFTVYGPYGRPDMAVYMFTKAVFEGTPITLFEGGALERDFTYIDDIVEGIARLLPVAPAPGGDPETSRPDRSSAPYRICNIGNSQPVRVRELVTLIEAAAGRRAKVRSLPMPVSDVPLTSASTDELAELVGFKPHTSLADGVERFVAWYRAYHGL
jgi:UDP-glucuronate 4-epimerase